MPAKSPRASHAKDTTEKPRVGAKLPGKKPRVEARKKDMSVNQIESLSQRSMNMSKGGRCAPKAQFTEQSADDPQSSSLEFTLELRRNARRVTIESNQDDRNLRQDVASCPISRKNQPSFSASDSPRPLVKSIVVTGESLTTGFHSSSIRVRVVLNLIAFQSIESGNALFCVNQYYIQ